MNDTFSLITESSTIQSFVLIESITVKWFEYYVSMNTC